MIQFNELRITPDASHLIIDVSIKNDPLFDGYGINGISINHIPDSENIKGITIYERAITEKDLEVYTLGEKVLVDSEESVYVDNGGIKHIRINLTEQDFTNKIPLSKGFFVVRITAGKINEYVESVPIEYASTEINAAVIDLYPFYKEAIYHIKHLYGDTSINKSLINLILRFKALELSIKTGNLDMAAYYWFKYFNTLDRVIPKNKCS